MSAGFPAAPPGLFPSFTNANNGGSAQPTFSTGSYFYPPQVNGDNKPRLKLKRTRQRVDAGEPRNTYNNIAGYTPGRVAPSPFGAPSTGAALYNPSSFGTSPEMGGPQTPQQNYFRSVYDNVYGAMPGYWSMPYFHNSLRPPAQNAVDGAAPSTAVGCKREAESDEKLANDAKGSEEADDDSTLEDSEYEVRQKKARVENIITTIQPGPTGSVEENGCARKDVAISPDGGSRVVGSEGTPKSKRKQYQPQQLDFVADDNDAGVERDSANRDEADDEEFEADDSLGDDEVSDEKSADHATDGANCAAEGSHMKTEIKRMRSEIFVMQQRYMEMFASQQKRYASFGAAGVVPPPAAAPSVDDVPAEGKVVNADDDFKGDKDLKSLAEGLKSELVNAVNGAVDKILGAYSRAEAERVRRNDQRQQQQEQQRRMAPAPRPPFYFPPFYYNPTGGLPLASNFAVSNAAAAHSIFPHYGGATPGTANAPFLHNFGLGLPPSGPKIVADEACVGFGANRKKRSKVTDTRVSKVPSLRNEDQQTGAEGSPTGFGAYPSMVSQQTFRSGEASFNNNSLDDSDLGAASPDNSDGSGSETAPYDPNTPQSTTLTPMHLRKAKLMFFYTRYPSSALLKAYFPDIRFNKNNTAQLVKWFSNFREFYYIQMEKYARQALAEGSVRSADEIQVCVDSELYKVLNLHYNRNNHIQVPPSFRRVIEATLREFFGAVQSGRDAEPSWKKAIYKIIARLDEQIPEYFKTPNFLEQLE